MTYHYTDSGLDNVYLVNGYTVHKTPYGEGVSIQDTDSLHAAIAKWIVERPRPMTGAELRFLRTQMNMTQRNLAAALGSDEQSVRRWEKAKTETVSNGAADRLVRLMYCDYVGGDGTLRSIIDRLAELDQVEYEDGRFTENEGQWRVAA